MKLLVTSFLLGVVGFSDVGTAFQQPQFVGRRSSALRMAKEPETPDEVDVVVIGSGLAGLSCAALLGHCEKSTVVLESHDAYGGACHTWERRGFHFESGPSLYSGFSTDRSPNPLKNIFQIIGEDCEWITYDRYVHRRYMFFQFGAREDQPY
jgi:glycine/D-amino acid oxidase-like deaminating enzyme